MEILLVALSLSAGAERAAARKVLEAMPDSGNTAKTADAIALSYFLELNAVTLSWLFMFVAVSISLIVVTSVAVGEGKSSSYTKDETVYVVESVPNADDASCMPFVLKKEVERASKRAMREMQAAYADVENPAEDAEFVPRLSDRAPRSIVELTFGTDILENALAMYDYAAQAKNSTDSPKRSGSRLSSKSPEPCFLSKADSSDSDSTLNRSVSVQSLSWAGQEDGYDHNGSIISKYAADKKIFSELDDTSDVSVPASPGRSLSSKTPKAPDCFGVVLSTSLADQCTISIKTEPTASRNIDCAFALTIFGFLLSLLASIGYPILTPTYRKTKTLIAY